MGIQKEIPHLCFLSGRCAQFMSIDDSGNMYSTCQENSKYIVGNIWRQKLEDLLKIHIRNMKNISKELNGNRTIYEELGEKLKFIYFQGSGCPNRMIDGKDYYFEAYKNFVEYVGRNSGSPEK
jgi:hypothetical protein